MNIIRIVKSDARLKIGDKGNKCWYWKDDTISAETELTAEEVAVLVGLDLDTIGYRYCDERMEQLIEHCENLSLSAYLRSHQAEIKRQEGKDE